MGLVTSRQFSNSVLGEGLWLTPYVAGVKPDADLRRRGSLHHRDILKSVVRSLLMTCPGWLTHDNFLTGSSATCYA